MVELLVLIAVVAGVALVVVQLRSRRKTSEQERALAQVKRVVDADVTRFGEELQELHIDTLATTLDVPMRQAYQRALDASEAAKMLPADAAEPEDLTQGPRTLEDGRHAPACALARQAWRAPPQRRPPSSFPTAPHPAHTT